MGASVICLFPGAKETIDGLKVPLETDNAFAELTTRSIVTRTDLFKKTLDWKHRYNSPPKSPDIIPSKLTGNSPPFSS
ncbi:MAG: hypothetical protein R6U27_14425 [Desulfobacterales bacterium]